MPTGPTGGQPCWSGDPDVDRRHLRIGVYTRKGALSRKSSSQVNRRAATGWMRWRTGRPLSGGRHGALRDVRRVSAHADPRPGVFPLHESAQDRARHTSSNPVQVGGTRKFDR